jgi:hypothetical protein
VTGDRQRWPGDTPPCLSGQPGPVAIPPHVGSSTHAGQQRPRLQEAPGVQRAHGWCLHAHSA